MAKEVCDRFEVRAKQLSRVLTGRKYLGGTQAKKHKATETATTTQEPPVQRKKAEHLKKSDNNDINIMVHMAKKNNCKSRPLHKYITAPRIIKSSSICTPVPVQAAAQGRIHKLLPLCNHQ